MKDIQRSYSQAQKEAIEIFDRELCVSAGAGSGKTSVLVERFLYAVTQQKIEPERILAITFTEKAAGEMKSRLVTECRRRGLKDFRRRIESCTISTIHSFCSRILKENPIEGGVDPFFQVLSESQAEILRDQVIEKIFEEECDRPLLIEALSQWGEETTRRAIKRFYEMSRAWGDEAGLFHCRDLSLVRKKIAAEIFREAQHLDKAIDSGKATESELEIKTGAQMILKRLDSKNHAGWNGIDLMGEAQDQLHRRIPKLKEAVDFLRTSLDQWISLEVEKVGESLKKEFERVSMKFKALYDEEKRERAAVDFDDLLFIAYRLLSGSSPEKKAVRARYQKHFISILVDEYQDTSPLQDKIIECLKQKNNLFVVGDVQQSIYGFRFADPELFHRRILASEKASPAKSIRLNENYRSRSEILKFINGVFEQSSAGSSFHPLEARRSFPSQKTPAVEFLCVARGDEESEELDRARVLEARSLAAHIQRVIHSKTPVHEDGGSERPIEYRDIAVLFRSMTRSTLYEKELSDLSIPYFVTKGGGFYEKPEILDFINCLKMIENPHLDIALAGVLRSPLVSLSDDGLFWLARNAKSTDRSLPLAKAFKHLAAIKELSDEDRKRLTRFAGFLEDLRRQKNSLKISQILEKIFKETSYEAKVLTRSDGEQKAANLLKLITIAESVEENNIAGIQDFIRYVQTLSDSDASEAEARVDAESGNAVMLSTIHAAKGLEFAMVIVADMGRKEQKGRKEAFLFLPEAGLGLKLKHPKTQKFVQDFTFSEIDKIVNEKESREEERLLYVALTRSRERLVLSGALSVDPKTGDFKKSASWMGRIARILSWKPSRTDDRQITFQGVPVGVVPIQKEGVMEKRPLWSWAGDPIAGQALKELRPLTEKEITGLPVSTEAALSDFGDRFKLPAKDYEETEDHTVTDLLLASKKGSEKFELFSIEKDREFLMSSEELAAPRNEYGTLFHRLMEYTVSRRAKRSPSSQIQPSMFHGLGPADQKEMKESIHQFWAGPWGKRVREAEVCFAELPFIYKTQFGILKGQMDLVIQLKTGEWIILDYKTNRLMPAEKETLAKEYELQLLLYAFVFQRLYGEAPAKGVLYFSNIEESFEFTYTPLALEAFEKTLNDCFKKSIEIGK